METATNNNESCGRSRIEESAVGRTPPLEIGLAVFFLVAAAAFSFVMGGYLLAYLGQFMATGFDTPHQDFITPVVYSMLFGVPLRWLLAGL